MSSDNQTQPALIPVGARVRLRREGAEGWLLPERRFAHEGRLATVIAQPWPERGVRDYRIEFDVKRRGATPVRSMAMAKELEVVSNGSN